MKFSTIAFLFFIALVFSNTLFSQTPLKTDSPEGISGGVLNGKATRLPRPHYPPAARAVKAWGVVNVEVLIDESGNVVDAIAVSGHPLLRSAAVTAAKSSSFAPTTLSGSPVKVRGVIVYNFANDFDLTHYFVLGGLTVEQRADSFDSKRAVQEQFDTCSISQLTQAPNSNLARDPKPTKPSRDEDLVSLSPKSKPSGSTTGPAGTSSGVENAQRRGVKMVLGGGLSSSPRACEPISESNIWRFNLGRAIASAEKHLKDKERLSKSMDEIKELSRSIPTSIHSAASERMKLLLDLYAKSGNTDLDFVYFANGLSTFRKNFAF